MARIAFFSIYAFGHTTPTLAVVGELTRRGHRVRYYSFSPFQKAIKAAGGEFDTIVYTSRAFQPKADTFSSKYAFIGPSIPEQIGAAERAWEGCCYISLGTVNNRNLPFYQACIEALRQESIPVVISVGEQTGLSAFRDVPEHIFLRPRVDQLAVLARASVFVTHCGMNSASEGLYFGVPLVLYPQQAEQGLVARRVEELGAGLRLRRASSEAIRAAVRQVREQRSYRSRAREIAAGFRDAGGYRRGADKILEAAARGGGACAENPPML